MALDEPKDTDEKFDIKGLQFVVDKSFMEKAEKINIDFTGMGFQLDSNLVIEQSGSGCSSCGSGSDSCGS
jgi:iron-sulfur cluster assembly protein